MITLSRNPAFFNRVDIRLEHGHGGGEECGHAHNVGIVFLNSGNELLPAEPEHQCRLPGSRRPPT